MHHVRYRRTHSSSWTFHSVDALHLPVLVTNDFGLCGLYVLRLHGQFAIHAWSSTTSLCDSLHGTRAVRNRLLKRWTLHLRLVQPWVTLSPQHNLLARANYPQRPSVVSIIPGGVVIPALSGTSSSLTTLHRLFRFSTGWLPPHSVVLLIININSTDCRHTLMNYVRRQLNAK